MKQFFFLFVMLASITASATVTITPLSVDYPNKKVTFRVAWTGTPANNRVWVWVDLCPVIGASPSTFAKAVISAATGSGVVAGTLNGRGFYVNVNGATVTATLSNAIGKFNWCAYGSDYPPNARNNGSSYTLKGSPPFIVTTASGTAQVSKKTYSGGTITALTDVTGCPGVLCGKNGESAGLLNCCVPGTTACSGTCKTNNNYTTNDGACSGSCAKAYVQQRNVCGTVINDKYSTYATHNCRNNGCSLNCASAAALCATTGYPYWSYWTLTGGGISCTAHLLTYLQYDWGEGCWFNYNGSSWSDRICSTRHNFNSINSIKCN
jgi:hypothetical protein